MTNHVHLLLTPPSEDSLARLMRSLGQRYVQYFNWHYGRTGTLWEGRFRSCITESARYVLACHRYIEMNPVRAAMVPHPEQYCWSSHAGNTGATRDAALAPHPEYLALGEDFDSRCRAYRALFSVQGDAEAEEIRRATNAGYPLASEAMRKRLKADGVRVEPGRSGRPPKGTVAQTA